MDLNNEKKQIIENIETEICTFGKLVLLLRSLVLALGESVQPPWWRSRYMNETGLRFLERVYPRSYFQAALHASGKAAAIVHDNAIGRRGVFHLFRLPESIETEVMGSAAISTDFLKEGCFSELRADLGDPQRLMDLLADFAIIQGGNLVMSTENSLGPQRIGASEALHDVETYKRMAGIYLNAFRGGYQAFPYAELVVREG